MLTPQARLFGNPAVFVEDPWLCVPASRRVYPFEALGFVLTSGHIIERRAPQVNG